MTILTRIILFISLTFLGYTQTSTIVNGKVLNYYAETTVEYSTYNGHMVNGNAKFLWDKEYSHTNSVYNRDTYLQCDFTQFENYQKVHKETCDTSYYLMITWNDSAIFCEVNEKMWYTINVNDYVRDISSFQNGEECQ